jgi:hypothetical protein
VLRDRFAICKLNESTDDIDELDPKFINGGREAPAHCILGDCGMPFGEHGMMGNGVKSREGVGINVGIACGRTAT